MTDHAGGGNSPLLSTALLIATEGVLRDTEAPSVKLEEANPVPDSLKFMNPIFRRLIFIQELNSGIAVTKEASKPEASVTLDGTAFVTLAPPSKGADLKFQLEQILVAKDLRAERSAEIVLQQSDVLSFLGATQQLNVISQPWKLEILRSVLEAAMTIVAQIKYALPVPRPVQMWHNLAPLIQTPQHSSFPSGHAAEGFAACYVLSRLSGLSDTAALSQQNPIFNMAARISVNRTVAGVHYPMDSMAGALMGITLGQIYWQRLIGQTADIRTFTVNGDDLLDRDFHAQELEKTLKGPTTALTTLSVGTPSDQLRWLIDEAAKEADPLQSPKV